jgi:hypothetical protein
LAISQTQNVNTKSHQGNFRKQEVTNRYLTEASLANLMLEGEGDTFWLYFKCETSIANRPWVILENEKQQTVTSLKPASLI